MLWFLCGINHISIQILHFFHPFSPKFACQVTPSKGKLCESESRAFCKPYNPVYSFTFFSKAYLIFFYLNRITGIIPVLCSGSNFCPERISLCSPFIEIGSLKMVYGDPRESPRIIHSQYTSGAQNAYKWTGMNITWNPCKAFGSYILPLCSRI